MIIPIFLSLFHSHVVPSGAVFSTLNVMSVNVFMLLVNITQFNRFADFKDSVISTI